MLEIFLSIVHKLTPLYIIILCGFFAKKYLSVEQKSFTGLLIYILTPMIMFSGGYKTDISPDMFYIPLFYFLLCSILSASFYFLGKYLWKNKSIAGLLAFSAGCGNAGYFGLPVAYLLYGDSGLKFAILVLIGSVIYGNTIAIYLLAKGNYNHLESLKKIIRIPGIYAFFLGLLLNVLNVSIPKTLLNAIPLFNNTFSFLGMTVIGIGLANIKLRKIDKKFLISALLSRFAVWPLSMLSLISFDRYYMHLFPNQAHSILFLYSLIPIAVATVIWATEFDIFPEYASVAVLISTIGSMFLIPVGLVLFGL